MHRIIHIFTASKERIAILYDKAHSPPRTGKEHQTLPGCWPLGSSILRVSEALYG